MTLVAVPVLLLVGVAAWRYLYRAYLTDTAPTDEAADCGNCRKPVAAFMGFRDRPPFVYCNDMCAIDHAEDRY